MPSQAHLTKNAWEIENAIETVDPRLDGLYAYDNEAQRVVGDSKPWKADPNYFKRVRISAVALLKMVMHARSGGSIEVMGIMQGKITDNTFIVMDAFRLPVEGTETRVNAANEANEYLVQYLQSCRDNGRDENAVGWYHSHPGYGCWLSGIDVSTQDLQQSYQDPFIAIVIDPDRTISSGKVDIGAFRTYPKNYKAQGSTVDEEYQSIPLSKIEDFGAHASRYYSLEISHFKSVLDTHILNLLWNKYWVSTLSQNPLLMNREFNSRQITDIGQKVHRLAGRQTSISSRTGLDEAKDRELEKAIEDGNKIAGEERTGLLINEVKARIFNGIGQT